MSDPEHALGVICRHARKLAQLESLLAGFTDPDTASHFQVANVRENRLILITPSAGWATRLRMQAPQLLRSLREAGIDGLRHIDIRVAPLSRDPAERKTRRRPSPAAQQALEQLQRLLGR